MVESEEKQYQPHTRVARQSRPILNGIIFLLATNLLAKGVLGLNAYTPPPTSQLHGSLYVNFGRPNQPNQQMTHQQQQYLPYTQDSFPYQQYTYWNPIQNTISYTTPKPQPIHQHQIINIHDGTLEDTPEGQFQEIRRPSTSQVYIEKQVLADAEPVLVNIPKRDIKKPTSKINNQPSMVLIKRDTEDESKEEEKIKMGKPKPVMDLLQLQPKHYELITKLAHLKRQVAKVEKQVVENKKNVTKAAEGDKKDTEVFGNKDDLAVLEKQVLANTTTSTTTQPTTTSSTSTTTQTTSTRAGMTTPSMNMTGNDTGPYGYYGNYTGNENVSITTMPSTMMPSNMTGNMTGNETTTEGYYYYPAGDYGPSQGNENISITYGPPTHYEPNQAFYPSQIDHFYDNPRSEYDALHYHDNFDNNYHHHHHQHNHYPHHEHHEHQNHEYPYQYHNQIQQFNDAVHKFYNKFDYHYPYFRNLRQNSKK